LTVEERKNKANVDERGKKNNSKRNEWNDMMLDAPIAKWPKLRWKKTAHHLGYKEEDTLGKRESRNMTKTRCLSAKSPCVWDPSG
jgi:hypothetical protein